MMMIKVGEVLSCALDLSLL